MTAWDKNSYISSVWLQMNFLIQIFFKFALFILYKELYAHKGMLIFLNESSAQEKLQKTEQWMQINPEGAL